MSQLDDMYRNYKNVPLETYIVDNGTFATGLNTSDNTITYQDLVNYDNQNTAGGHGLYVTNPFVFLPYGYVFNRPISMPGRNDASFVFDESYEY